MLNSVTEQSEKISLLSEHLRKGWVARTGRDIIGSIDRLCILMTELSLPQGHFGENYPTHQLNAMLRTAVPEMRAFVAEVLVFWSSILRARDEADTSSRLLDYIATDVIYGNLPGRAALIAKVSQEKGLNFYVREDFSSALDQFLTQVRYAQTAEDRYRGAINALLCAEALGLAQDKLLLKAQEAFYEVQASGDDVPPHYAGTLYVYELGRSFFEGRLDDYYAMNQSRKNTSYVEYFIAWTSSLPWHRYHAEHCCFRSSQFYVGDARIRTLQGRSIPDDLITLPAADLVIRSYVWLWRWLMNPSQFSVDRVYQTLSAEKLSSATMPPAQRNMLRATLEWLSLFDSNHRLKMERWAAKLVDSTNLQAQVFMRELNLIHYIKAVRDGNHVVAEDLKHVMGLNCLPSDEATSVYFERIALSLTNEAAEHQLLQSAPHIAGFVGILRKVIGLNSEDRLTHSPRSHTKKEKHRVVVDLNSGFIEFLKDGDQSSRDDGLPLCKKSYSKPLVDTVALLKAKKQVSYADFMSEIWNIHNYDPIIHDAKILNLLARLRVFLGDGIKLGVKDKVVFAHGHWNHVKFIGSYAHSRAIADDAGSALAKRMGASKSKERLNLSKVLATLVSHADNVGKIYFSRMELERVLDMSRSTTNRVIEKLILKGTLVPNGDGPRRIYRIINSWEKDS